MLMEFEELEANRHQMNISKENVEYIRDIIKKNKLKNVLEIGCFNGYSALQFSTVAKEVKTIEIDKHAVETAKNNFKKYNIKNIEKLEGDAKTILDNLRETFDVILIDAMKSEYKAYLVKSLKLVKNGSFIFADNTISHKDKMKDFFDYLKSSKLNWKELGIGKKDYGISGLVEIRI